jgi:hypothetical protein
MPFTIPVLAPIVATVVVLLVHPPPPIESVSVSDDPIHTTGEPFITPGNGYTVTIVVTEQPSPRAYVIVTVPADTPTTPTLVTIAIAVSLLLHVPPVTESVRMVIEPTQTESAPKIGPGDRVTVIITVAMHPVLSV